MLVLDTHVLIWWVNGDSNLPKTVSRLINRESKEDNSLLISAISAWEISMLIEKERLVLAIDIHAWLEEVKRIPAVRFIPIEVGVAVNSTQLPGKFHNDPADRMIVALAREYSVPLITADEKILSYQHVKTVWEK